MHQIAEEGVAAHWKYKEGKRGARDDDQALQALRSLVEWTQEVKDSRDFLDSLKLDLYPKDVYAFTPMGKVIQLAARRHAGRLCLHDSLRSGKHLHRRAHQRPHGSASHARFKMATWWKFSPSAIHILHATGSTSSSRRARAIAFVTGWPNSSARSRSRSAESFSKRKLTISTLAKETFERQRQGDEASRRAIMVTGASTICWPESVTASLFRATSSPSILARAV